jgi:hypothetical protein
MTQAMSEARNTSAPLVRATRRLTLWVLVAVTAASAFATQDAQAADPQSRVVYAGRIEDAQGRPIGGIFPLTFSFFRAEKGGRAAWTESHFVAVDNGVYAIELGRLKALPKNLDVTRAWLSVSVTGGKEIVRDRFAGDVVETPAKPVTPAVQPANPAVGAPPQPAKGTYADLAGFAYEAEKAKSAETIGGLTAADLRNLAKQAQTPPAATAAAKAKIGATSRLTDSAGGSGGSEFVLQCPPGHVATGIRGRGAVMIDALTVICSPLE